MSWRYCSTGTSLLSRPRARGVDLRESATHGRPCRCPGGALRAVRDRRPAISTSSRLMMRSMCRDARRPLHEVDQRWTLVCAGIASTAWEGRGAPADAIAASQKVGRRAQTPSGIILK